MEQTSKYHLSQWAGEDRILREDFNADNVKTENALVDHETAQSKLQETLAASLTDLIVIGTYVGEGSASSVYGSGSVNLGFSPRFLIVRDTEYKGASSTYWHPDNLGFATREHGHYTGGGSLVIRITETGFDVSGNFSYKNHTFSYFAVR